ncbi:MAG TPA: GIY-YIG nuclease family protein [Dehalococcoidia bacterium]|nr:GIY-YIG nuclease family protein [Dehalococcoidia bacterium]
MQREYYVYIMTNKSGTLYIGVTNNLLARVDQHKNAPASTFTGRYKMNRLVYFESTDDVSAAIGREKQLKGWLRKRKIALIESMNPRWVDLGEELFNDEPPTGRILGSPDSSAAASE